jgi:hypothetical protein
MNAKNHCLPQTFKHYNSEESLIFKDFRIFYSIFLLCNFQLGFTSCGLGNTLLFLMGNMIEYRL